MKGDPLITAFFMGAGVFWLGMALIGFWTDWPGAWPAFTISQCYIIGGLIYLRVVDSDHLRRTGR